jgi:hypothetical protein
VVTALSWFNPQVKAFSPAAISDAFHHLGVDQSEIKAVLTEKARLESKLR